MPGLFGYPPQPPIPCWMGHPNCELHSKTKPDLSDLPGYDSWPKAGNCYYGCVSGRLYQTPKDDRWLCPKHLRRALKAGGYPIPLDE